MRCRNCRTSLLQQKVKVQVRRLQRPHHGAAAQQEWRKARSYHLSSLLSCNVFPERNCIHCTSPAIIRCRDCMPEEWLCMDCDIRIHAKLALHNRESCIDGIYKPIDPTDGCMQKDGRYTLFRQGRKLAVLQSIVFKLKLQSEFDIFKFPHY